MSGVVDLTPQQRAAVETPGSLLVRAGAGSGKTAVLVERYVRLLGADASPRDGEAPVDPLGVDQILAVTFTEKAAAEMRSRIRERLAQSVAAAPAPERSRLLRLHRSLASARIGTIHSLAASIVRAAPLESGAAPGATVLDEIEGAAYVEREVRRALLAALRAGDPDVRRCADAWGFGRAGDVVAVTCESLATLGRRGLPPSALATALARQDAAAAAAARDYRRDAERLVGWIDGALADGGAKPSASARTFTERWPEWRAHLTALAGAADAEVDVLVALRDLPVAAGRAFRQRAEWETAAVLLTSKMQEGTSRFGGTLAAAFGCARGAPLAAAFTRVLQAVDAGLAASKRRDGVLTFDDLIAGARRVLGEDPATAARLTEGVRALLVDEFQDTDPAQVDLVRRLVAGGAELFVVGDEKQSIYRFRGAEVQLFGEMRTAIGREVALADNFRSRPPLLAFVNGLAARIFAPAPDAPPWRVEWSADQRLRARRPAFDGDGDGDARAARPSIRLISLVNQIGDGATELRAAQARALEARVVAATVAELRAEGWRWGSVAVLLPALTQVKAYEYALRRWAIPYEVVRGRGFYECQEIRDLVGLLTAVVDPDDAVALAGALRSPLFGLSDDTLVRLAAGAGGLSRRFDDAAETFADLPGDAATAAAEASDVVRALRAARDRVSAADLLAHAIELTGLESVLRAQFHGEQKVANIRKLVTRARTPTRTRFPTTSAFVAEARRLVAGEAREPEAARASIDGDVVRVMTIHQAKGLEFPVVILPDLGREAPRDYRSPVVVDDEHGILAYATFGSGRHRLPHRLVDAWRRTEHDRTDAERARLLYVACTRARDLLILCEGKGRRAALAPAAADDRERSACEQVWTFLGREAIAAFVASSDDRTIVAAPGEDADGDPVVVAVEIEKSSALLARVPPPERDPVDASIGRALELSPAAKDLRVVDAVAAAPPAVAALVVTPTALGDFSRCPRQFWYRHVRGLPESGVATPPAGGATRGASDAVRRGIAAHAALEVLDLGMPPEARQAAVTAALARADDLDARARAAVARDVVGALARFAAVDGAFHVHGRELPFCLPLSGPPPLFVRGRIDLLGERAGRLVVRDYKYALPADDAETHRVQLETYALAVAAAHGGAGVDAEVEWLRAPGGRATLPIDLDAARARIERVGVALAAALAAREAAAFPLAFSAPGPCRALGCPFVERCFARGVATDRRSDESHLPGPAAVR